MLLQIAVGLFELFVERVFEDFLFEFLSLWLLLLLYILKLRDENLVSLLKFIYLIDELNFLLLKTLLLDVEILF